ncbi:MAG TPA: ester cyclase [Cyclobacteriaceae bacterium]
MQKRNNETDHEFLEPSRESKGVTRKGFVKTALVLTATAGAALTAFARPENKKNTDALEEKNKQVVGKWLDNFWGPKYNASIIDELAAPDMILQYSLHKPRKGRADIKDFMKKFRDAFPDLAFEGAYPMLVDGEFVIARWVGGGTHTGTAFSDWPVGALKAATGRKMRFTGTTVFRVVNGKITEEIGLDDGLTALLQLELVKAVN